MADAVVVPWLLCRKQPYGFSLEVDPLLEHVVLVGGVFKTEDWKIGNPSSICVDFVRTQRPGAMQVRRSRNQACRMIITTIEYPVTFPHV